MEILKQNIGQRILKRMRNALLLVCLLLASPAWAGKTDATWNPPVRFDHPFTGKLTLYRLPQKEVVRICQNMPGASLQQHGCSQLVGNRCTVVIINKTFMGAAPASVLRHEIGHCNGWPANHPD
jgi:hypothetical protein